MYANIMINCQSGRGCMHRMVFTDEFPIPQGDPSGTINTYHILVKLADLHNYISFPAGGSHIDTVYVYVPAFWGAFSRNLV